MRCVALAVEYDTHIYMHPRMYFKAFRTDFDKRVQGLENQIVTTACFTNSVTCHPLFIWAQIVPWWRRRRRTQNSGCLCNADLPVWLHSKHDAAKNGTAVDVVRQAQ